MQSLHVKKQQLEELDWQGLHLALAGKNCRHNL